MTERVATVIIRLLSMKCCANVAGFFTTKKKEVNYRGAENTEAKQKVGSHFRKKSFAQRHGDAKKRKKNRYCG